MSYSAPALVVTGDIYSAAQHNTDVVQNVLYLKGQTDGAAYLVGANAFTGANSFATNPLNLLVGQVKFPAAQNASADANTLDDYEEGLWTPTLEFGGNNSGITYSVRTGNYTKVGNLVRVYGEIRLTSKGANVGAASVAGFPFSSADSGSPVYVGHMTSFSATTTLIFGFVSSGGTTFVMEVLSGGSAAAVDNTNFTNTSVLIFSATYRTS